ncbi:Arylsulfatase [Pontiella desulfatans]|uniref:Arylsulfatase n=1 Tax=Pontiella desulfatans TaxID=2750659 RepID=A0A6C2U839_PONDE|nr:sulfatase-like hydrolase/transferase [Pontiella desulfatans]SPS73990.1 sulfatase S1_29 [Kiritimatiellales bacterium]VGO15681.1 Arylsulfatase [Pontiella desulfatans]
MKRILIALLLCHAAAQAQQNNILLIIGDDIGLDSLHISNDDPTASFPPIPTLQALAKDGVLFSNGYAYPTCSPTRSSILTGRYGYRTGVLSPQSSENFSAAEYTLPEIFADQGLDYELASFGKWHLGGGNDGPNELGGWPHFSGALGGGLNNYRRWTKVVDGVETNVTQTYATTENTKDAAAWINAQGTNNWFAWIGFNAAHTPLHQPPPNLFTVDLTGLDTTNHPRPFYEAIIEAMDNRIGWLLDEIDTNNTTIIFIGDNGTANDVIQPPYDIAGRAKGSLYEGGTHVPFFIWGADVADGGRTNDSVVHVADLFATIIELAGGVPPETGADSRSLVPILDNGTFAPAEDSVLVETDNLVPGGGSGRGIRSGSYKLIRKDGQDEEFYNLSVDPLEEINLLEGSLGTVDAAIYDALAEKLDSWTNTPMQVYVDLDNLTGPWDGTSWTSAFQTVQAGIDEAEAQGGANVWVAEGIYRPATNSDRSASFMLESGVHLLGGFDGSETSEDQRNPAAHVTTLSGDLGADNSYHVIVGANGATLDGFTITGGKADGAGQNLHGAGLFCVDEISMTVNQCIFTGNHAHEGAGVYAYNASSSDFTDCVFSNNTAKRGAALLLRNGCSGTFSNCTFAHNVADWAGGAIYADYGSSPWFHDCTFSANSTTGKGGAFFTDDLASQVGISSPVFIDCSFAGNSASYRGGGIYNFEGSETAVTNTSFVGNSAGTGGGAIANDYKSELTLSGNTFLNNSGGTGEADVDSDATSVVFQ